MDLFGKKLMPVSDLVRRPPVHSISCRLTLLTGLVFTAAAVVFIAVYAVTNGTVTRDTISDNACSDGFTMHSDCRDVSLYPLVFDMQLHDFLQAKMVLDRRPQSEEELHAALAAMSCSVKRLGDDYFFRNEFGGVFESPDGLPYVCASPRHPWVRLMLLGYSASFTFKRFFKLVEMDAAIRPPPNTSELKFQIAGASVGKGVASSLGYEGDDLIAYAHLLFRMDNRETYWWGTLRYCNTGETVVVFERDCFNGFPFHTAEDSLADPLCTANYSADLAEYLMWVAYDIVGSPAFFVEPEVRTFDGMLETTCNNFSKTLSYNVETWDSYIFGEDARDADTLITLAVNDVLSLCPFQFTCTSEELTFSNMLTVAFPLLSFLSKALGVALPIVYAMWLKCIVRKSAANLMEEHMGHRLSREAQDKVSEEIKLLVDEEVRKAVAQIRDELFMTFRTDGAPDPEAQLTEAPFPPMSAENRETLAKGGCAGGKSSAWRKELDDLQERVATAESMLASLRAILAGFAGEEFPGSLGGVGKPAAAPAMSVVDGTQPTALARAPRTATPGGEAVSSAYDAATSGHVAQHAGSQEGHTSVSMFATGGCASASLRANGRYDPAVV